MLLELAKETEVLDVQDTLGSVVSRMQGKKALPVFDKKYCGMLYLRDLVVRDFDVSAKIGGLVKKARKLENGNSDKEIIDAFLEYPLLPAFRDEKFIGLVDSLDFLEALDLEGKACEYARETEVISPDATLGNARNLLRNNEVALVEENGKIIGGIDIFSLAKQIVPKKGAGASAQARERGQPNAPEKIAEKEILVRPVMTKAPEIGLDASLKEAILLLKKHAFLVCGEFVITPKTILRGLKESKAKEGANTLTLVGFDFTESFESDLILKEIETFAKRAEKLVAPQEIKFHLKVARKLGKDVYSIDAKVVAGGKVMTVNLESRVFLDLIQEVVAKLDAQILKLKREPTRE